MPIEKADKVRAGETTGSKMDSAWDKTKATTKEVGTKVKDAVTPDKEKGEMAVDVRGAQQALRDKGFDPGPVDGRMGPRTAAAVREFQSKENIIASGQLDAETRGRLMTSGTDSSAPAASPATTTDDTKDQGQAVGTSDRAPQTGSRRRPWPRPVFTRVVREPSESRRYAAPRTVKRDRRNGENATAGRTS